MENEMKSDFWFCPLYKKEIAEGLCLDINYERLEYFKGETLKDIMTQLHKTKDEIDFVCENCPNLPLKEEE
jgi:hypothetical protein